MMNYLHCIFKMFSQKRCYQFSLKITKNILNLGYNLKKQFKILKEIFCGASWIAIN